MRPRTWYALAILAVLGTTIGMVLYAEEDFRLKIIPWLWIALTLGLGVSYARLDRSSPDRPVALQLSLLVAAFMFLWVVVLVPRDAWIQNLLGGLSAGSLAALVWVRNRLR